MTRCPTGVPVAAPAYQPSTTTTTIANTTTTTSIMLPSINVKSIVTGSQTCCRYYSASLQGSLCLSRGCLVSQAAPVDRWRQWWPFLFQRRAPGISPAFESQCKTVTEGIHAWLTVLQLRRLRVEPVMRRDLLHRFCGCSKGIGMRL